MQHNQMPTIDLNRIKFETEREREITARIINPRTGELRASKPKVARQIKIDDPSSFMEYRYDYANDADALTGEAAYVWRMVAFQVSPISQHHCMPCTAEFDVPGKDSRTAAKQLDKLVARIVDSIPKSEWHGIKRWGQVYGLVGTPRYNDEGAVIYR